MARPCILVVDDDAVFRKAVERTLEQAGHLVHSVARPSDAIEALEARSFDLVLTDLRMPGLDGIQLVQRARTLDPDALCIVVTGFGTPESSIEALGRGAFWFVDKDYESLATLEALVAKGLEQRKLRAENRRLEAQARSQHGFERIIGSSQTLRRALEQLALVAETPANVLLLGESGTGKELFARALHAYSPRATGPFVAVNCGAIPEQLLESELFGHVRGAFTGAERDREGRLATAQGGTLLLDEIGDMSPALQTKLLRVLQEREFEPVGSGRTVVLDARIVAATHRDLEQRIREGRFRSDLYFRLSVVPIRIPPLRERLGDVPELAEHFLALQRRKYPELLGISDPALKRLCAHEWPGNVRELEAAIERAAILRRRGYISEEDLPEGVREAAPRIPKVTLPEEGLDFSATVGELEQSLIRQALEATGGNRNRAAQLLGLKRTTLLEKMRTKGIS
ncbi:MAG: sigma-54-dependent transcriptional regulator [Myxococcota bacterium]